MAWKYDDVLNIGMLKYRLVSVFVVGLVSWLWDTKMFGRVIRFEMQCPGSARVSGLLPTRASNATCTPVSLMCHA
jgi:hypothetical protein